MDSIERWMRAALALAERGRGRVEPNPLVGAVVLDREDRLAGEGWHQQYGGPHAEVHALHAASERARDGTLIVTLEPCCHWGKTPPCTDAIVRAGIRRVFAAMADPFPQVDGGGLQRLRAAGLEVHADVCEPEARRLNAPYLKLLQTGKPWVHLKWAMTLDGKIATRTKESKWISGKESQRRVHELRGRVDAIVVGRGTVAADDPLLTARPPGPRIPLRVVVTGTGQLPEVCQLRSTARDVPVLICTGTPEHPVLKGWVQDGAEIVTVPQCDTGVSLEVLLNILGQRRCTNVLVEGVAGLLGSFVDAALADEFHVFIAPKLFGGDRAPSPVGGVGVARLTEALRIVELSAEVSGDDIYLHGAALPQNP